MLFIKTQILVLFLRMAYLKLENQVLFDIVYLTVRSVFPGVNSQNHWKLRCVT